MNDIYEALTKELLDKMTNFLTRKLVRGLNYCGKIFKQLMQKSGRYQGEEMTEQVVRSWINNHGGRLHEMRTNNPKYSHLINQEDHLKH